MAARILTSELCSGADGMRRERVVSAGDLGDLQMVTLVCCEKYRPLAIEPVLELSAAAAHARELLTQIAQESLVGRRACEVRATAAAANVLDEV